MTLKLPNLDDRKYKDLIEEALKLIPTYAPEWTNHNPSDPGITLLELFAYLTEMLIYRLNRISDDNKKAFLKLLNGPGWIPSEEKSLNEEIRDTVLDLRKPNRAVTCKDFEALAIESDPGVARAHCVPGVNLASPAGLGAESPGCISIIIVPRTNTGIPDDISDLLANVTGYLDERRLLTTRVRVFEPNYLSVGIRLAVGLKPGTKEDEHIFTDISTDTDSFGMTIDKITKLLESDQFAEEGISEDITFYPLEEKKVGNLRY